MRQTTPADARDDDGDPPSRRRRGGSGRGRRWQRQRPRPGRRRRSTALRRKGFGRLLVDGRAAVSFDDVEVALLKDQSVLHVVVDRLQRAAGHADAADRFDRDGVQRRGRRGVRARAAGGRRGRRLRAGVPAPRLLRAVRVPGLRHRLRGPAAAAVLVQQPVRRVPDVPRLRQRHRARHRPGRARPDAVDPGQRHRAVEQAALPGEPRRPEARGARRRRPAGRAVGRPDGRREAVRHRRRRRRVRGRPRLLRLARAEEVQGARPRVPEPLPRLPDVPRLRRRAAAPRGARRAGRRPDDRPGVRADGPRGAGGSSPTWRSTGARRPSPTRC